jgi:hypothetical protein
LDACSFSIKSSAAYMERAGFFGASSGLVCGVVMLGLLRASVLFILAFGQLLRGGDCSPSRTYTLDIDLAAVHGMSPHTQV